MNIDRIREVATALFRDTEAFKVETRLPSSDPGIEVRVASVPFHYYGAVYVSPDRTEPHLVAELECLREQMERAIICGKAAYREGYPVTQ